MRFRVPIFDQSDCSICENYDLKTMNYILCEYHKCNLNVHVKTHNMELINMCT